jgi:hypothetical protein
LPTTVLPGSQGFTLTVHGANFAPSAVLEWNGSQRPTVVVSGNVLQATINTSDLTTANFVLVTVVNLGSNPQTSNTALFTIRKPAPAVALTQSPYFVDGGNATVGDFNGDGKPDIATCGGNVINAYLGQGRNKFGPPIKTATNFIRCRSLFTGDFNGDHLLDLAVDIGSHNTGAEIWFGDGTGKFTQGPVTPYNLNVIGIADLDGDGFLDLLAFENEGLEVLFGTGGGDFGSRTVFGAGKPLDGNPVIGDFNEDGYLDVALPVSGGVKWLLTKATGPSRLKEVIPFLVAQSRPPTLTMTATWTLSTAPERSY